MNLVINAIEAVNGKGSITLTTANTMRSGNQPDIGNAQVVLSVTDTGPGIDKKDVEHIFEPFYTNKVMGKSGTGLGLTVVWNTMEDHNGNIEVESGDEGTTFKLFFPVAEGEGSNQAAVFNVSEFMGKGESILVVDDEPQLRDIASQILNSLGYATMTAESGETAIQFLKETAFDLVILDMMMEPGINGRETYQKIIEFRPQQKAIIASGFSESSDVEVALKCGVGSFLKKPYSLQELCVAVKEELAKVD